MNPYDQIERRVLEAQNIGEMENILFELLNGNFSVWEDGSLYSIKQLVSMQNGLKIEVYPNEHPPPHFHVKCGDIKVSFSIEHCELLRGKLDGRRTALIKWWHKKSKSKLIDIWNKTRPSDCMVGPIIA